MEARRSPEFRLYGETLLAYLKQVPARASTVSLPDPAGHAPMLEIALDPKLTPQANAARYFKRAASAKRGMAQIPARLAAAEREERAIDAAIAELTELLEVEQRTTDEQAVLERRLDAAIRLIPEGLRSSLGLTVSVAASAGSLSKSSAPRDSQLPKPLPRAPSARLQPRRLQTAEGWEVLIGRSNEGNDHLTLHLARPEDYWFHVHGAAGSHVVLRRGKGKNEPSKQTIEEVAAWAAHFSQARTAGKVPVIVTRKKYVRKPRGAKPGTVICEREKTVMVRPKEPAKSTMEGQDAAD